MCLCVRVYVSVCLSVCVSVLVTVTVTIQIREFLPNRHGGGICAYRVLSSLHEDIGLRIYLVHVLKYPSFLLLPRHTEMDAAVHAWLLCTHFYRAHAYGNTSFLRIGSVTTWLFFRNKPGGHIPTPTDLHVKWIKRRGFTQEYVFCSKSSYFLPAVPGSQNRQNFANFGRDLENFRSSLTSTLEVPIRVK